ncbi:MAG: hypothetical protein Kow0059_02720 [Candidatus Sumerlaeia bacterium]
MHKPIARLAIAVVGVFILSAGSTLQAQNPFMPPTSAMDELSAMGPGPSAAGASPFNPAVATAPVTGAQPQPYGASQYPPGELEGGFPPVQPAAAAPYGSPYAQPASPFGQPATPNALPEFGQQPFGQPAFGQPTFGQPVAGFGAPQPGIPVQPKVTVLKGERYFDNFTKGMLEEAMVDEVPEAEVEGQYFDDGTHNDAVANDKIFTNVTENYDYVGQLTHKLRKHYVNLLLEAEALEPMEFFRLLAVTNDPLSTVNHEMMEEKDRDERLRAWNLRFLAFARINPQDEKSDLHPLFVPRAPEKPDSPLPKGYDPRPPKQEEQQQQGFGGTPGEYAAAYWAGEEGGAAGMPRGAASSRYF